jgi:hypothetical protein
MAHRTSFITQERELRCRQGDVAYKDHLNVNDKSRRWTVSSTPPITDERGGILDAQQPTHARTRSEYLLGPQTTTDFPKKELLDGSDIHTIEGLEGEVQIQHNGSGIDKGCSNVNNESKERLTKSPKATDKHAWHIDNAEGRGNTPGSQQMTRSRTHKQPNGHQTAISPFQPQSSVGSSAPIYEEPRGHTGDARYGGYLNRDDESKRRLMKSSVSKNKRSTVLYSPKIAPKAPDKRAQHTDDKLRTKAHYAPQPKVRNHVNNTMRWETRKLIKTHQQSQHDICHETENTAWGHVMSNRGSTAVGMSTNTIRRTGKAIQKPACNDNDDWSSLGPKCGAKNNTEQLSECSDELSEVLSDVREPDEDRTGSLSETVHMACIREIHHYQVDRDLDDGEPHPEYEDEIIPCYNAQEHGQNCESPVERHWVESEVPDWIQDSDENSPKCEGEDDNEDDFEEEPEAEEDPFVNNLELEVENW